MVGSGTERTREWREEGGYLERSGSRRERLFGMTAKVTVRPRESNRRVRSRRGMMWPEVGKG